MSEFIKGLIIGLFAGDFLGCFIGVALMALLAMARDPEPPKREPERKEPTPLWTVGNICKWSGKIFEIYGFETYYQNQTLALLKSDDGFFKTAALVEELEVVEE